MVSVLPFLCQRLSFGAHLVGDGTEAGAWVGGWKKKPLRKVVVATCVTNMRPPRLALLVKKRQWRQVNILKDKVKRQFSVFRKGK